MVNLSRPVRSAASSMAICLLAMGVCPAASAQSPPSYKVDPNWPKQLPNNWILGMARGLAVDKDNHIWVLHGRNSVNADELGATQTPPRTECCIPAPPVLEFDTMGNLLKSWGGPAPGDATVKYDWPNSEHSIYVDRAGNVWISGNNADDRQVLKFTNDGKFLLQIGRPAHQTANSSDTTLIGRVAGFDVDEKAREIYMADGYLNRRVIVFDSETGAFKRMWGAYGHVPDDAGAGREPMPVTSNAPDAPGPVMPFDPGNPAQQFKPPVHCVRISNDGLLYVCDRGNDRIQVFTKEGKFVKEFAVRPGALGAASVCNTCVHPPSAIVFSRDKDQAYLFVTDGQNNVIWTVRRSDGAVVGRTGHQGQNAGQFHALHSLGSDAGGNLYTGENQPSNRIQKFVPVRQAHADAKKGR